MNQKEDITRYRGWVIRPKKNGKFEVAYRSFSNHPSEHDSIENAKKDIDWVEDGKSYAEGNGC